MKKFFVLSIIFCLSNILLTGCGKTLTEQVTQNETKVKLGSNVNLVELFTCEEGVSIGFSNTNSFDSNKLGSYSLEATITDGDEEVKKTYIVEVYDDEAPKLVISDENIVIYENDKLDAKKFVSCTDNSGESIDINVDDSKVDISKAGEYEINYSASDSSGNRAELTAKVNVKKAFTYKKLKSLVENIIKNGQYDKLEMEEYKNDKEVTISFDSIIKVHKKKEYAFVDYIALALSVKDKKIVPHIFVIVSELDASKYLEAGSMRIESENGVIISDKKHAEHDYDYGYNFEYSSDLEYYFNELEALEKFPDIVKGNNLALTAYTDKRTLKHKCTKSDIKGMKQLGELYAEILKYM